ncbi:OLC1v1019430C1 [Oldenlandia corymbosa var. corymbosa]|uniref:OLC1v1019430C1 n=1 Tax=Oldenlandia corymbosa var. corymbosa TaxID=529605 RepID=A0AAV1EED0_OLDCO|nr:OLC1v1019430C1 [Oldenlandia corymbosa var. corymbosa]
MLKLPDSPPPPGEDGNGIRKYSYHLGFDLINKRYKLLKTCCGYDVAILTVGVDSAWRILDASEQMIKPPSKWLGGILCWEQNSCRITAFDLTKERFIHIDPVPREVFPSETSYELHLVNFGPNLVATSKSTHFDTKILRRYLNTTNNGCGTWLDELPMLLRMRYVRERRAFRVVGGPREPEFFMPTYMNRRTTTLECDQPTTRVHREGCDQHYIENFRGWSYFEENIISLARLMRTDDNRTILEVKNKRKKKQKTASGVDDNDFEDEKKGDKMPVIMVRTEEKSLRMTRFWQQHLSTYFGGDD